MENPFEIKGSDSFTECAGNEEWCKGANAWN
jgi:hypothetical protein